MVDKRRPRFNQCDQEVNNKILKLIVYGVHGLVIRSVSVNFEQVIILITCFFYASMHSNWFNMANANHVNLLLLSELNALVKTINEASQSNEKMNSLRNSIMVGDIKIPNKNLKSCVSGLLNLKFDRSRSSPKLYGEELNNYLKSYFRTSIKLQK